jgi:dTDP-4-dehydrorhamnose reductase
MSQRRVPTATITSPRAGQPWFGFAKAIFESPEMVRLGVAPPALEAIPTSAYPTPACRPANSRLDCTRLERRAGLSLVPWDEALQRCLAELS